MSASWCKFDTGQHVAQLRNWPEDIRAFGGVGLHDLEFFRSQSARFFQNPIFDADFANVMQLGGNSQNFEESASSPISRGDHQRILRDAIGMATRVRIFFVDRAGEHLDRAHEQRLVLLRSALQVFNELLKFFRHGVEGRRQFANLGTCLQMHALREIAPRDRLGWIVPAPAEDW